MEKYNKKPKKKFSSFVIGMFIIFSALAVMNITTMIVRAETWNGGLTIENETVWRENCNITMQNGDLLIKNNGTLVFNNSVNFTILCSYAGEYGITIESGGKFIINSSSANTKIVSDPDNKDRTYPFTNSGTIDLLGATVERVYGDPSNKSTTGGIRNNPGSVCNLTNCIMKDTDTHGLYIEGSSASGVELNIDGYELKNTTSGVLDGSGIWIKGNSTVEINGAVIKNLTNHGIYLADGCNDITIVNSTFTSNGYGVYIDPNGTVPHDNSIYHNNFKSNLVQAYDGGNDNLWNKSYPWAGNYWDNYTGVDLYRTEYQNVSPADGIGDSSYVLSTLTDNFPWRYEIINGRFQRPVVRIESDNDFHLSEGRGVTGGDGSASNPWIIERFIINGTGTGPCVYVKDTTEYFTVRNCYLHNITGQYSGIEINNVSNCVINNTKVSWIEYNGIYVTKSNVTIEGCTIVDCNGCGIVVDDTLDKTILIKDNIINSNNETGIYSYKSKVNVTSNYISSNGPATRTMIDDMESGEDGWNTTNNSFWHRINSQGDAAKDWHISKSGAYSWWYGIDENGTYDNNSTNNGTLTYSSINRANETSAGISFWSWVETDNGNNTDLRKVTIKSGPNETTHNISGEDDETWVQHFLDVSEFVGSSIDVKFSFDTVDDSNNSFQGWYIDDLELITPFYIKDPDADGCGIYMYRSTNCNITDNKIRSQKRWGILVDDFSEGNQIISNNITHDSVSYGIYLKHYSSNNFVQSNEISLPYIAMKIGDYSQNNTLSNNNIIGNSTSLSEGITLLKYSSNNILKDNTITNICKHGIKLDRSGGNIIKSNTIQGKDLINSYGCYINYLSMGNNISNNHLSKNYYGVYFKEGSSDNIISQNTITTNKDGIFVSHSLFNQINNNIISQNSRDGISIEYSSGTVANNTITISYNDTGIKCKKSMMCILDNTIESLSDNSFGLIINESAYVEIGRNIIKNNTYGVFVSLSTPIIYGNDISDNYYGIFIDSTTYDSKQTTTEFTNGSQDNATFYPGGATLGYEFTRKKNINPFTDYLQLPRFGVPHYQALGAVHPDVLYFEDGIDGYKYWMYYTPFPGDSSYSVGGYIVENPCLVRSNDGINFTDAGVNNPLITPGENNAWDHSWLADPDVIKVGNQWYMYYTGVNMTGGQKNNIGIAISDDGKTWTKYSGNPISDSSWYSPDSTKATTPSVYYNSTNETYKMLYSSIDNSSIGFIHMAYSTNGTNWTVYGSNPVLSPTPGTWNEKLMGHPDVIFQDNQFRMYHVGSKGGHYSLGVMNSDLIQNGTSWTNYVTNPILSHDVAEPWENRYIYRSSPVIVDGTMKLYYSGYGAYPNISLATDSFPLIKLPKGAKIINACFDLKGNESYTNPGSYTSNVALDIGADGEIEWNHIGDYGTNITTIDDSNTNITFTEAIQNYLDSAETSNGNVEVPLIISSDTPGWVNLTNLSINWNAPINISGNNFISNTYGLDITASYNASIYHNNFVNTNNADDSGTNNTWDNGYPSGGNYWSDYYGNDTKSGANQNLSGSDGIGDTNYTNIGSGSSVDRYPLMRSSAKYNGKYFRKSIRINNNDEFTSTRGVTSGNGSESNPWIIEDYDINGTGYGCCIYIGNTTDYAVVKNSDLFDASGQPSNGYYMNAGINLYNITNGSTEYNNNSNNACGIYLSTACNNILSTNNVSSNNGEGFRFDWYSCNNTVTNNTISNNNDGIYITTGSNDNTITANNISSNDAYGIFICDDSCSNNITDNDIASNDDHGVSILSSSCENNTVYHNCFYNNNNSNVQAYDVGINNTWDNGYPSGGNYWSDFNGVDYYGGANQTLNGSDGIGDWPYNLTGTSSSQDNYPHMYPDMVTYTYWAKTYNTSNNDRKIRSSEPTSDGGLIVGGYTYTASRNWDFLVLKLSSNGTIEWEQTYGGPYADVVYSIIQSSDGNYVVAGYTCSYGNSYQFWVLKLSQDSEGGVIWNYTYGGNGWDVACSIQETFADPSTQLNSTGYIITGYTTSPSFGGNDLWIIKLFPNGTVDWQKRYGSTNHECGLSIIQTSDGGYIACGRTKSFGASNYDVWVLKLDEDGIIEWEKRYGGSNYDYATSIQETDDGYIIAASTQSFGGGNWDFWVLKLNTNGALSWSKTYGGSNADIAETIRETSDGGYIVTGRTNSYGKGGYDAWTLKLESDGDITWQKTYGGSGTEITYSIFETSDRDYIMVGRASTFGSDDDLWVVKVGANGGITFDAGSNAYVNVTPVSPTNAITTIDDTSASVANTIVEPVPPYSTTMTDPNCITITQATPSYGWCPDD